MPFHALLIAVLALHGADLVQTEHCLAHPSCQERNPVFAPLSQHPVLFGAAKIGGAAGEGWYLASQRRQHPRLVTVVMTAEIALYSGLVYHNAQQLHALRH